MEQALYYSGKRKSDCNRNVVVAGGRGDSPAEGKTRPGAKRRANRALSRARVVTKHASVGVKRSRIAEDVLRNTKDATSDAAIEMAAATNNLRSQIRKRRLKRRETTMNPYLRKRLLQ